MSFFTPNISTSMQDVLVWTIAENKKDYITPVRKCEQLFQNRPLSDIPANLAEFKARFPLDGFDPRYHRTEKAYKAWRRKVIAAIKGCMGQIAEEMARRARQDDWASLIDALVALVEYPDGEKLSHQSLIPIRKLADLARQHGKRPNQVTQDWLADVRPGLNPNEWKSVQSALRRLNHLRELATVAPFLPAKPYGKPDVLRFKALPGIPAHIAAEIVKWVSIATRGAYDPVEEIYVGGNSENNISYKTSALRKFVSTLSECVAISDEVSLCDLLTPDNSNLVVRRWTTNSDGVWKISARTAFDYMRAIRTTMFKKGVCPNALKHNLDNNRFLNEGKKQDKGMSHRVRQFCETLVGSKALTMSFLSLHVQFRNQAQALIDEPADVEKAVPYKLERIRALGTVAAICAVETRGAPIRIESALELLMRGDDITFHLPNRMTDHATIALSPEHTKNESEIWAPIRRGNMNGLEVIEWYLKVIRPLYPNADRSPYLFPGIETDGALQYRTFLNWFKRETRRAGLPMTPHNFRHGLASLLIQANPGRWDLLERLLDDTVGTARSNYGWVNKRTQRSDVQKFILDLSEFVG